MMDCYELRVKGFDDPYRVDAWSLLTHFKQRLRSDRRVFIYRPVSPL